MKKAILLGAVLFTFWGINCNAQDKVMDTHTTESKSDMKSMETVWQNAKEMGIIKKYPAASSVVWEHAIRE